LKKNFYKAHLYWPQTQGGRLIFGPFSITLCDLYENHQGTVIRSFQFENLLEPFSPCRWVTQLHYVDWPDHGCPRTTDGIRNLIKIKNELQKGEEQHFSPVVVHCSAGIGRAGTFIAIDILIRKYQKILRGRLEHLSSVMDSVMKLRTQRRGMIQTFEQYQFIYSALQDFVRQKRKLKQVQLIPSSLHDHVLSREITVCEQ